MPPDVEHTDLVTALEICLICQAAEQKRLVGASLDYAKVR